MLTRMLSARAVEELNRAAFQAALAVMKRKIRGYTPHGAALRLQNDTSPELIISGPARTGKSRACLEKLFYLAEKHENLRALILRKTRASLTETGLVTFERDILGLDHPLVTEGTRRSHRQSYDLENGSTIVIGGIDKPGKVLSAEYDLIYVQQAEELTLADWETLISRLSGLALPQSEQQIIADCNPEHPQHWIKLRCDRGGAKMIESHHEDNPLLYDREREEWTEYGKLYIEKLKRLTGVRYQRLYLGLWTQAEGAVYPEYSSEVHIVDPFEIPETWRRFRAVDFGFRNPFVCLWFAVDPDGRLYVYREIYKTRRTVSEHARHIKQLEAQLFYERPYKDIFELRKRAQLVGVEFKTTDSEDELLKRLEWDTLSEDQREAVWWAGEGGLIEATVCDHDAEDMATLEEHGIGTSPAEKAVRVGIDKVKEFLAVDATKKPALMLFSSSLVEIDRELEEEGLPFRTAHEFPAYVWDGKIGKDTPVKANDHGMDTIRYGVRYADQDIGILI